MYHLINQLPKRCEAVVTRQHLPYSLHPFVQILLKVVDQAGDGRPFGHNLR